MNQSKEMYNFLLLFRFLFRTNSDHYQQRKALNFQFQAYLQNNKSLKKLKKIALK